MKKFLNFIGILLSLVVIIALLALELWLGIKVPIKKTMEVDNLSEIMEKIDIERIFRDEKGNEKAMGTRIYHYFDDIGLSREEVDKVVKDKRFKRIIGNYLGTMFMHKLDKTEVIYPSKAELVDFIHKNYNSFKYVTDFPEDYDQKEIERIVSDNYGNVKYELDELSKDIKFDEIKGFDTVEQIFSIKTIYIIGGIILCVILLVVLRHSFYRWLKWVSVPTFISGAIFIIAGLLCNTLILSRINYGEYSVLVEPVVNSVFNNIIIYGVISIGVGIVMAIIYYVINKIVSKKPKVVEKKEIKEEIKEEKVEEKVEEKEAGTKSEEVE